MAADDLEQQMITATKEISDGGAQEVERNVRSDMASHYRCSCIWITTYHSSNSWRTTRFDTSPLPPLDYDAPLGLGFDNVDNLGNYHPFNFRPKMKKVKGKRNLDYQTSRRILYHSFWSCSCSEDTLLKKNSSVWYIFIGIFADTVTVNATCIHIKMPLPKTRYLSKIFYDAVILFLLTCIFMLSLELFNF